MSKYPCNVIKDLLPSFIDGVCSEKTNADIEEHLKECASCKALFDSMKEDLPGVSDTSSLDEKKIIQKVNKKINSKDKTVRIICIGICSLVILATLILIVPIKKIPKENLEIKVTKEPLTVQVPNLSSETELYLTNSTNGSAFAGFNSAETWKDNTLFLFPADKSLDDCMFIPAIIDTYPDYSFAIDSDYRTNKNEPLYINMVTISSDYAIKSYYEEYRNEDGKLIFNLKNARTTLFGKQATNVESNIVLFSIDDIDGTTIYAN